MSERLSESQPSAARNIYAFGITSFLNDTASEMAYWVLPAFLVSLGAGPTQLGLIEGLAESVASFAKLFSGYLTDRIDRRKPLVVAGYFVVRDRHRPGDGLPRLQPGPVGLRAPDPQTRPRADPRHRRDPVPGRLCLPPV